MNKIYPANIKLIKKNYLAPFIAVGLPFFQLTIVVLVIICFNSHEVKSARYYQITSKALLVGLMGLTIICAVGIAFVKFTVSGHRADSFIHVTSKAIIISRYSQRTIKKLKFVYHKKLYIIKYSELENIILENGKIILKGKVRFFSDRSDRLGYSFNSKDISFDKWWYDYNPNDIMPYIKLNDIYINTKKAAALTKKAAAIERERIDRFYGFRAKTLEKLPLGKRVLCLNNSSLKK